MILLSTLFIPYLCQSQTKYQIHTKIKYHKFIFLQIIHQHLLVQTNMLFLIKLVIHTTIKHHIPYIQFF